MQTNSRKSKRNRDKRKNGEVSDENASEDSDNPPETVKTKTDFVRTTGNISHTNCPTRENTTWFLFSHRLKENRERAGDDDR